MTDKTNDPRRYLRYIFPYYEVQVPTYICTFEYYIIQSRYTDTCSERDNARIEYLWGKFSTFT